jgi:erythromycin esterase
MGFTVLALESDFYSLNAWQLNAPVKDSAHTGLLISQNIYPIWTQCGQCKNGFLDLASKAERPGELIITGFDNQMTGLYGYTHFAADIKHFLDTVDIPFNKDEDKKNLFLSNLQRVIIDPPRSRERAKQRIAMLDTVVHEIDEVYDQLSRQCGPDNFYLVALRSFKSFCREKAFILDKNTLMSLTIRDEQMAENLLWLANKKYPQEKIIVWAANYHIIRNKSEAFNKTYKKPFSMGYLFGNSPGMADQTYIMCFTGFEGISKWKTSGRTIKLSPAGDNSLEGWINKAGFKNGFIDFKPFLTSHAGYVERFSMRGYDWLDAKLNWVQAYDGVFYIGATQPCE